MPSKIAVHKPAEPQSVTWRRPVQVPLADKAALKPPLRTPLELNQLVHRLRTAPETVSSREFNLLSGVIGLRSALMLLDQGKRTKPEQEEQTRAKADKPIVHKPDSPKTAEIKSPPITEKPAAARAIHAFRKTSHTEDIRGAKTEVKPAVDKPQAKKAGKAEAAIHARSEGGLGPPVKVSSSAKPERNPEAKTEGKTSSRIDVAGRRPADKPAAPGQKSADNSAAPGQKSPAAGSRTSASPLQARKATAKAPVVHIKGSNPGGIIQQLGSIAPAEISHAYNQAVGVSGEALGQQRQQAEKALPAIPTPTGIAPGQAAEASKRTAAAPLPAAKLPVFQSGKQGGGTSAGINSFPQVSEETDPDQMMEEASRYAANPPEIGLTGEADPAQVESFHAEAKQHMQSVQASELEQTRQDFGENRIQPKPDKSILRSAHTIRAVAPPAFQLKSTGVIPPDVAGYLNPQLEGPLQAYMANSQATYQKGKAPFEAGITAAQGDTKAEIERLKTEASGKQQAEQAAAKAEVLGYRTQWQEEIKATSGEFDREAGTAAAEKNREIKGIKDAKEGEVKRKLSEAEAESRKEYKNTKSQAEEKQKEGESEGEQKKKAKNPWEWLKQKGKQLGEAIQKGMNFLFTQLRKAVKAIFDKAKQAVVGLIEAGRKLIVSAIKGFGNVLKGIANTIFARFPGIAKKINGYIDRAVNKAVQAVNTAAASLKKGVSAALDFMGKTVDKLFAGVQSLYNGIISGIGKFLSGEFKINFGKALEVAQIAAEVAAAFATGGGSVLVQIATWLTSTLPKLLRQANTVMTVVSTLRNFKVQNLKQFLNPAGMGGFLVKGLFGELKPLQTGQGDDKEKDTDGARAPKGGGQEKGLLKVLQLLQGVFEILQKTAGKVAGAINKVLPVINISGKSWFNPFSMVYVGMVQGLEVLKNPAEALNQGADKLKEAAGSFFKGIRGKVTEAASGIKARVQLLGKPAQLMPVLANKSVDMVLNFIISNPPSALIKAVFKGIEAVAGQSLVDLIRQHIPFADKLINKIAASSPVQGLLQPLQGPVDKVGGLIDEATEGATGLVDEAQSQANQVFGNGTKLLANLSGVSGGGSKDSSGKNSSGKKEEPKAGGKAGAAKKGSSGDFVSTVKSGVHTRLLAFGKQLLKSGVNLVAAGAGKLKNAIAGLLVNFKIGKESHQLWVEKRGSGHVVMMASEYPQPLPVIIKGFETRIEKLNQDKNGSERTKAAASEVNVDDLINQLKASAKKFGATPVDDLTKSDLETVVPLIRAVEMYLEKKEGVAGGKGKVFSPEQVTWTATRPKGTKQTYAVYQRNDIEWDYVRNAGDVNSIGKTNADAAKKGLAPQLNDGSFSTLHHLGQDSRGPLVEASTRYHGVGKYGQDILHSQYGRSKPNPKFPIDRNKFGVDTREYWKWRVKNQ
ncbi:HNH/ENDO VII family nuclease [Paenibacillus piscarius]|uniref:HNH/ENDO VII family nuclease n=1 Tax=Paenibacillus piscarius TaxID=1089681 RepID=UPI001EE8186F|nr:HNH/ENDO VII family nuclease [Paenibacillus piscarius]